ncbi:hypothetical protein FQZ97_697030 [compost metagenome]
MAAVHRQQVVVQQAGDAAAAEGVGALPGPERVGRHDEADLVPAGAQLDDRAGKLALEFIAGRGACSCVVRPAARDEAGLVPQRLVEAQAAVRVEGGGHQPAPLAVDEQRHHAGPGAKAGFAAEVVRQLRVDAALPEHVQVETGALLFLDELLDDVGAILAGQGKGRRRSQQHAEHRRQAGRSAFRALARDGRRGHGAQGRQPSHRQCAASLTS